MNKPTRNEILINNLLDTICECTDITKEQYEGWLTLEVGFAKEEIEHFKNIDCFPVPVM